MGRVRTGIVLLAMAAASGCSSESAGDDTRQVADDPASSSSPSSDGETSPPAEPEEACELDRKTLLPAMESAMAKDATARMTMEMSGPQGPVFAFDAVIAYTRGGPEMELASSLPKDPFALVYVDDRFFVSPTGEKGPLTEVDASDPIAEQMQEQVGSVDVTSSFDAWRAGLESVDTVGEESIGGEPVCQYTLEVDTAAAMSTTGEPMPQGMPDTIVYRLSLTTDDLMRRVQFDLGGFTSELNATRWNEPVKIEVPVTG